MNASKRIPSALLLTALCTTSAWAAELPATVVTTNKIGSVDVEYRWNYTIDTTTRTATFESVEPDPFGDLTLDSVLTDGVRVYTVKKLREGALANAQGLTSVTLPAMLAEVGPFAFSNCTSLATVTIPEGVRYIGERAFVNTALTQIDLPSTLLDMGGNIAAGTLYTATINIGDSSHFTYSDDGVLYNRDMTKLYACPSRAEGTITIPDTVTNICADAFFGCFRLAYLNLPENVNTIGSCAFNVRGIWDGVGASEASAKLTSIFYNGDRPNAPSDIYEGTPTTLVSYAFTDSWAGLTTWMGRGVNTIDGTNPPVLSYKDANGITWHYRIIGGSAEIYNEDRNGKPIAAITPTSITGSSYTIEDESGNPVHASALRIPANINGYAVTRIGDHAFDGCSALPYIGIPSSVLSIGDYAFAGCTAVKAIAAAADVPFSVMDGTATIPSGVTAIGYHPFEGIKASSVSLPYTITALDGNPVAGCDFVGTLEIDASCPKFYSTGNIIYNKKLTALVAVPANYDSTSLTILSTVTEIGPEALFECENIDTITLPDSLKTINRSAFSGCSSIVNLSIPAAVAEISETAFKGCSALTRVTFSGNAPTAAADIYEGADNVTTYAKSSSVGWPTGTWCDRPLVLVGDDDMEGGDEFSVTEGGITWYFRGADGIAEIYRDGGTAVSSEAPITSLTLPTTLAGYLIKGLGEGSLSGLRGITSITVPDTYEWIEANAFAGCSSLSSVSLPEGITRIGDCAFADTSLAEIRLPSTVKTIGSMPFDGTNLTALEIPRSTISLNGNPGAGCINLAQYMVADGNRSFKAEDDLLFNYSKTELIACQAYAEEITIPSTVTSISQGAFSCCFDLLKVMYRGNAPACDDWLYDDAPNVVSYASETATGFSSGTWKDRPIVLVSDGSAGSEELCYDDGTTTWYFRVINGVAEIWREGPSTAVVNNDGSAITALTLPETLGGYVVKGIGECAMANIQGITSISIPETYAWIGDFAFSNCTSLASCDFNEEYVELGTLPFYGTRIAATGSVTDENGVTWDYEVTAAGAQVTKVSGATGDVTIPARLGGYKVGGLNPDALNGCSGITSFASNAKALMVRDGVLYSADGSVLIRVPDTCSLGGTCMVETTKATFAEVTRTGTATKSEYKDLVAKFKPTAESKVENAKDGTVTYSIVYQNTNTTNTTSKKFDVPGDIDLDSIIAGVTEIADYAFMGVGSLSGSANVTTNSTVTGTPRIESNYLEAPVTYTTTCVTSNYTYKLTVNPKSTVIGENAFAGIDVTPVYVEAPVVTLDGTTVDLSALFLRANSDSEIVANGIAVSGSVGKQKISADGGSVDVPAYYTATKTGSTVTLELNEKARPVIAGNSYEDAMIVSGNTVTIRLESSNPDLYYALGSSDSLSGPWTVGEYVKGASSLKTAKPSGDSAFFKVFVTDIRP